MTFKSLVPDKLLYYLNDEIFVNYQVIELNDFIFNRVINTPADGHCLLYSFQMAYLYETGKLVCMEKIKHVLLEEYKKLTSNKDKRDFLTSDILESDLDSKLLTSTRWRNNVEENIEVNKFYLINYLENKFFNSTIVDIVPRLLSSGFKCKVAIYEYHDKHIYARETFTPSPQITPSQSQSSDGSLTWDLSNDSGFNLTVPNPTRIISILFVSAKLHYMAFTNSDTDIDFDVHENLITNNGVQYSLLPLLNADPFYRDVSSNFEQNMINLHNICQMKIEKKNLNLKDRRQIHKIRFSSIMKDVDRFLEKLEMLIENSSNERLINRFKSNFKTKNEFLDFMNKEDVFPQENEYFKNILQKLLSEINSIRELNDPKLKSEKNKFEILVCECLVVILKLCSIKGLYSVIDLKWQTFVDGVTLSLILPCQGILVDSSMGEFEVIVAYNKQSKDYSFTITEKVGSASLKEFQKINKVVNNESENAHTVIDLLLLKYKGSDPNLAMNRPKIKKAKLFKKISKVKFFESSENLSFMSLAIFFFLILTFVAYFIIVIILKSQLEDQIF